jgi:transcription termination/antitermination protein NusG
MVEDCTEAQEESAGPSVLYWYALYTYSHCEDLVYKQLSAKGFQVFLPKVEVWSRRAGRQSLVSAPVFPSYLFLHHVMDKMSYVQVRKVRGLVRILGEGWDRPNVVPDKEMEALQKVLNARLPILSHHYLKEGQRVRITSGPLAGTEGVFLQSNPARGRLLLSIDLLQRSIAVEVECSIVVAA